MNSAVANDTSSTTDIYEAPAGAPAGAPPGPLTSASLAASFRAKTLRDALAKVAPAVPARSPKPVLQNVLLTVHPNGSADVQATDLERGARFAFAVDDPITCEPGECLLSPAVIGLIGQFHPDASVRIECSGDAIRVESGRHRSRVPTDDPALFPRVPIPTGVPEFARVDGRDFKGAVKQTVAATDPESTRYALGGCLIAVESNHLAMVATNGRFLVRRQMVADLVGSPADGPAGVAPASSLKLAAGMADEDSMLAIHADANAFMFAGAGWSVWSRRVEGRFPRYQDVFPTDEPAVVARVDRELILGAVNRVAKTGTSPESRGIDFQFTDGVLELTATAADCGSANEAVPCDATSGGSVTLGQEYLDTILKSAPNDLTWRVVDHKNAVVIRDEAAGYSAVIMPLRRDR